jgi:hypothetical protein
MNILQVNMLRSKTPRVSTPLLFLSKKRPPSGLVRRVKTCPIFRIRKVFPRLWSQTPIPTLRNRALGVGAVGSLLLRPRLDAVMGCGSTPFLHAALSLLALAPRRSSLFDRLTVFAAL